MTVTFFIANTSCDKVQNEFAYLGNIQISGFLNFS